MLACVCSFRGLAPLERKVAEQVAFVIDADTEVVILVVGEKRGAFLHRVADFAVAFLGVFEDIEAAPFCVLQFLPDSRHAEGYTCDRSGRNRSRLEP